MRRLVASEVNRPSSVEAPEALSFLQPYPAGLMNAVAASPLVNSVRNDFRDLLKADALAA